MWDPLMENAPPSFFDPVTKGKMQAAAVSMAGIAAGATAASYIYPPFAAIARSIAVAAATVGAMISRYTIDPPDANYTLTATFVQPTLAHADSSTGMSSQQITAINNWVDALGTLGGYLDVVNVSLNRAEGAKMVGDMTWFANQVATAQVALASANTAEQNELAKRQIVYNNFSSGKLKSKVPLSGTVDPTQAQTTITSMFGSTNPQMFDWMNTLLDRATLSGYWPQVSTNAAAIADANSWNPALGAPICPAGVGAADGRRESARSPPAKDRLGRLTMFRHQAPIARPGYYPTSTEGMSLEQYKDRKVLLPPAGWLSTHDAPGKSRGHAPKQKGTSLKDPEREAQSASGWHATWQPC